MTFPGLTVRPDLSEEQIIRLIRLLDSVQPRNWYWLTDWLTGGKTGFGKVIFGTAHDPHDPHANQSVDADDVEGIISAYENPANWLGYTGEDIATA